MPSTGKKKHMKKTTHDIFQTDSTEENTPDRPTQNKRRGNTYILLLLSGKMTIFVLSYYLPKTQR